MMRVLILGGTTEANALARAVAGDARFRATLSLAGATRSPLPSPLPCRIGGFGGADGLARFLRAHAVDATVDATHPFAQRITANARAASAATGAGLLRLTRPAWIAGPGDRWTEVDTLAEAAIRLGPVPRRVLLTVGRGDLAPFAAEPVGHDYLVRSVDPPPVALLPPRARAIAARGPFTLAGELALLDEFRVDVVVTKNAGGDAVRAKLDAARLRGLRVVMVRRPPEPASSVPVVLTPADAHAWLVHACRGA